MLRRKEAHGLNDTCFEVIGRGKISSSNLQLAVSQHNCTSMCLQASFSFTICFVSSWRKEHVARKNLKCSCIHRSYSCECINADNSYRREVGTFDSYRGNIHTRTILGSADEPQERSPPRLEIKAIGGVEATSRENKITSMTPSKT